MWHGNVKYCSNSSLRLHLGKSNSKIYKNEIQSVLLWGGFLSNVRKSEFSKRNSHCHFLEFYKTWSLGWKVKFHSNFTFRLFLGKSNGKTSKKKPKICLNNFSKNNFSAIIRLFQFLDHAIIYLHEKNRKKQSKAVKKMLNLKILVNSYIEPSV